MGDSEKKASGAPTSLIVAALVVAVSLIAKQFDLESRRPQQPERSAHYSQPLQTVPARLWQDPLAAISDLRGKSPMPGSGMRTWPTTDEIVKRYLKDRTDVKQINVILVPVFGGAYSEYGESRRRQRYALAAGLLEADFAPVDAEKLGVLRLKLSDDEELDVPFEWYDCKEREPKKCNEDAHALVMWVNDDLLGQRPMARLMSFYPSETFVSEHGKVAFSKTIVGPAGSGTLIAMLSETQQVGKDVLKPLSGVRIFSPNATIGPDALWRAARMPNVVKEPARGAADSAPTSLPSAWHRVQTAFQRRGVTFVSTIGADDRMAEALAREATLRQYSVRCLFSDGAPPDCVGSNKVLIVAEGDTEYARSLADSFTESLVKAQCAGASDPDCRKKVIERIFRLTYLRGLDGETSRTHDGHDKDARRPVAKSDARSLEQSIEQLRAGETAAGNVQFDYLRRLGRNAKGLERAVASQGLALFHAIAIFGSDTYDKLLVMQVLRSEFPSAYFMTTDMDARYLQREQLGWSRNVIVASSYGLELSKDVRAHSAPFRDTYQSAQFVAARLAVAHGCETSAQAVMDSRLGRPRLFEISTAGPVELRFADAARPATSLLRQAAHDSPVAKMAEPLPATGRAPTPDKKCPLLFKNGQTISSLHDEASPTWPRFGAIGSALLAVLALAAWYSLTVRRLLRLAARRVLTRWPEIVLGFGVILLLCLPQALLLHFAGSAFVTGLIFVVAHPGTLRRLRRLWPFPRHVLRALGKMRAVLFIGGSAFGAVAAWLFLRAWMDEAAAYPAAALSLPLAAAGGVLTHPIACRRLERRRFPGIALGTVIALLLAVLLVAALTSGGEEPTGFLNGASSWLSEALRLSALVFNLWAIGHVFGRLHANEKEIHARFFPGRRFPIPAAPSVLAVIRSPRKWLVEEWKGTDFLRQKGPHAESLWGSYTALCRPTRLAWRASIGALLFFLIFFALTISNPIVPPVRGVWSTLFDTLVLLIGIFSFFWLIFLVVDVVRLTSKFVHYQSIGETEWPQKVLPDIKLPGLERVLRDAADLDLLSRRTEVVSRLVILPFIPLMLLVLARHEVVDAWAWTWQILLLFAICFAFLIVMSMQLRGAAEKGRTEVMTRLTKFRLKSLGQQQAEAAAYLETLIKALERMSTGAYSPLWQADWLRGLAIPTTGFGMLEILHSVGML
jgi:hypothetical protein